MIVVLGASGYVGSALCRYLQSNNITYRPVSRSDTDYYNPEELFSFLENISPDFLINASGYTGKPNVDACEVDRVNCLNGNAILPGRIKEACDRLELPWGHVSSGCIYTGDGLEGNGFTEDDPPNFSFRSGPCSFYSGTKALGEELLDGADRCYVWRLRIPFDHRDSPRNYISKIMNYDCLLNAKNSISHCDEFAKVCIESYREKIPFGIYNVTNPGYITTAQVANMIQDILGIEKEFRYFASEEEFMNNAALTPRSNCTLSTKKLDATGLGLRPVEEALIDTLSMWEK